MNDFLTEVLIIDIPHTTIINNVAMYHCVIGMAVQDRTFGSVNVEDLVYINETDGCSKNIIQS